MSGSAGNERLPEDFIRSSRSTESPEEKPTNLIELREQIEIIKFRTDFVEQALARGEKPDWVHFLAIRNAATQSLKQYPNFI